MKPCIAIYSPMNGSMAVGVVGMTLNCETGEIVSLGAAERLLVERVVVGCAR